MGRYLAIALVFALTAEFSHESSAQQLRDPTRPPAGIMQSTGDGKTLTRSSGLSLQSILIAPDRRSAIIDGRLLEIGQNVSGYRVVSIEEGSVILKGSQGTRRLQLFPEIDKRKSLSARPSVPDSPTSKSGTNPTDSDLKREEG